MPRVTPTNQRRRSQTDPDPDGPSGVRLHKYLADRGIGSRRACEDMIAHGRVTVNGSVVTTMPVLIDPTTDRIIVDGEAIRPQKAERRVYVLLNKPRKTLSTTTDPDGRRTCLDLVDHPSGARLFPVGRLDYDTMGLLLLTNDGDLANGLTHPGRGVEKTYRAVVKGNLDESELDMLEGVFRAVRRGPRPGGAGPRGGERRGKPRRKGGPPPVHLSIVKHEPDRTVIDITLAEGRGAEVQDVLARFSKPVKKLVRIRLGPLELKGVELGAWRDLSPMEVHKLRRAAKGERQPEGTARPSRGSRRGASPGGERAARAGRFPTAGGSRRGAVARGDRRMARGDASPSRGAPRGEGPSRVSPSGGGSSRGGPSLNGPGRITPSREGPRPVGPSREGPSRGAPSRGAPSRGAPSRGGAGRGGPSREGYSRGGPSRGASPSRGGPSRGGSSRGGPSRGGRGGGRTGGRTGGRGRPR